jgi:cell division protein FtsI/penicillin-binding protein 2
MVEMKYIPLLLILLVVPARCRPEGTRPTGDSLFAQAAGQALEHEFPNQDISFLLLDAHTGQLIASRWEQLDYPIALGSLAKPFAALAYGEEHDFRYPVHHCRGTVTGCWRPSGHGEVDLTSAIAYSCNSYFRALTANLTSRDVYPIAIRFGLEPPDNGVSGAALAGLGPKWKVSPLHLALAYIELAHRRDESAVKQILNGMEESAREGTGAEVDRALRVSDAAVKTGTAECTHARHAPGDGFVVALVPADDPKILLMVRVHGVPGAQAARTAGQVLWKLGN